MKHYKSGIKRKGERKVVPIDESFKAREYLYGLGRRKTARATARLYKNGAGQILVNGFTIEQYFPSERQRIAVRSALVAVGQNDSLDVSLVVSGGGKHGQATSAGLAVARALLELNPAFRPALKKSDLLTRDARAKERKKPGLKRARRAPQWSKR